MTDQDSDTLADDVLRTLAGLGIATEIVLGGYFAMKQRIDYRRTYDIDAWWKEGAPPNGESLLISALARVAERHTLALKSRHFGETFSCEFLRDGKRIFSFQISIKTRSVEPPVLSSWPPLLIETPSENAASKMNALVNRGSPRDFRDIRELVRRGVLSIKRCWELWSLKNQQQEIAAAKQRVLLHLSALELRRPLTNISSAVERNEAEELRTWFKQNFLIK